VSHAFDEVSIPRIVLAGAGRGSGKTTLTAGIIAAYRRRGLRVKPFKVGPDFVDAAYLAHVAGAPCRNLDPWILGSERILQGFHRGSIDGDLAVVEGMQGLYDAGGTGGAASTAELSKLIQAPVVLVLDVGETIQSAAAMALGFRVVDPGVQIAGVILNRVRDEQHAEWVEEAVWRLAKVPVLGWLPMIEEITIPLVAGALTPVTLYPDFAGRVQALADAVERRIDLDVLRRIAERSHPLPSIPRREPIHMVEIQDSPLRLGVAYDDAFDLYYPENLELLSEAGAEIVAFSPLDDSSVPDVEGLYLAGAWSEPLARRLATNWRMLESIRAAHDDGMPIYAECGGLAYLSRVMLASDGDEYPMAGILPIDVRVDGRGRAMGYREMRPVRDCMVAPAGMALRGHELSTGVISAAPVSLQPAYELFDPTGFGIGLEGFVRPGLMATNIHLHFGQEPALARNLLRACAVRRSHPALT